MELGLEPRLDSGQLRLWNEHACFWWYIHPHYWWSMNQMVRTIAASDRVKSGEGLMPSPTSPTFCACLLTPVKWRKARAMFSSF